MLFHITYNLSKEQRDAVQERFKSTGALPSSGVEMKGRWHSVDGDQGFILAESKDLESIGIWIQEWSNLLKFHVTPVLTDEQIGKIIS